MSKFKKLEQVTSKDKQNAEWVSYLFGELIDSGIDEDAHWRVFESYISDFSSEQVIVDKPSIEELKNIDMDLVIQYLKPSLKIYLQKVIEDYISHVDPDEGKK